MKKKASVDTLEVFFNKKLVPQKSLSVQLMLYSP